MSYMVTDALKRSTAGLAVFGGWGHLLLKKSLLGELAREVLLGEEEREVLQGELCEGEVPLGEAEGEVQLGEAEGEVQLGKVYKEVEDIKSKTAITENGISVVFGW